MAAINSTLSEMLKLAGIGDVENATQRIFNLESKLAAQQWDKVDNRDADKRYNKLSREAFYSLLSNFNVDGYMKGIGIDVPDEVLVGQPKLFCCAQRPYLHR